jgi:hypothetical protein
MKLPILYEFIEAPAFSRYRDDYLNDEQFQELQKFMAEHPEAGDPIPGAGGVRKLRWEDVRRGKGKRGGLRIIYFGFLSDHEIWLMTLYDKSEASDLTREQKRRLKQAIQAEKAARGIK